MAGALPVLGQDVVASGFQKMYSSSQTEDETRMSDHGSSLSRDDVTIESSSSSYGSSPLDATMAKGTMKASGHTLSSKLEHIATESLATTPNDHGLSSGEGVASNTTTTSKPFTSDRFVRPAAGGGLNDGTYTAQLTIREKDTIVEASYTTTFTVVAIHLR